MGWQDDPVVKGKPKWESDPIVAHAGSALAGAVQTLDIRAGSPMPQLWAPSNNPYSAGRYPLGRNFTVGDKAVIRKSDILTGIETELHAEQVTLVDVDNDRVEFNHGKHITDLMGNALKKKEDVYDVPQQWAPTELYIGKRWTTSFQKSDESRDTPKFIHAELRVVRRETVQVPAGSFDTFAVEGAGWNVTQSKPLEVRLWLVPSLNWYVKMEQIRKNPRGKFRRAERFELVSLYQQNFG